MVCWRQQPLGLSPGLGFCAFVFWPLVEALLWIYRHSGSSHSFCGPFLSKRVQTWRVTRRKWDTRDANSEEMSRVTFKLNDQEAESPTVPPVQWAAAEVSDSEMQWEAERNEWGLGNEAFYHAPDRSPRVLSYWHSNHCGSIHYSAPNLKAATQHPQSPVLILACPCRKRKRRELNPCSREIVWSKKWHRTPVFLSGKFHGQRSPTGYSLWGCRSARLDSEFTHTHTHTHLYFGSLQLHFLLRYHWVMTLYKFYVYHIVFTLLYFYHHDHHQKFSFHSLPYSWSP